MVVLVIVTKLFLHKHCEKQRFENSISAYSRLGFANEDLRERSTMLQTENHLRTFKRIIPVYYYNDN